MSQTLLFAETLVEFWRDFIVILNSDPKFKVKLLNYYDLFSFKERTVIGYEPTGEKRTNLLFYLLKMKIKYSANHRKKFQRFIEDYSRSFNVFKKQWNELSKSLICF